VQWEGQTAADASWSPLEDFIKAFPVFQLELFQGEGGNVVDSFYHKYTYLWAS
jgi:hypothetical protein